MEGANRRSRRAVRRVAVCAKTKGGACMRGLERRGVEETPWYKLGIERHAMHSS